MVLKGQFRNTVLKLTERSRSFHLMKDYPTALIHYINLKLRFKKLVFAFSSAFSLLIS